MNTKILGGVLLLIVAVMIYGVTNSDNKESLNSNTITTENQVATNTNSQAVENNIPQIKPDKIEIIEFHDTQRCASCLKAEELLKKTIDTKFSQEAKDGIIVFRDIDIDLPENAEIANKFQATGLSIGINAISDGKDNLEYDMGGWGLLSNEEQYIAYFEEKINKLLGK